MSYNICIKCKAPWGVINTTIYTCNCPPTTTEDVMRKINDDLADVIDNIYDCLEEKLQPEEMKAWLRAPNQSLPNQMSPNEMMRAGRARDLLPLVRAEFSCPCASTPPLSETLQ